MSTKQAYGLWLDDIRTPTDAQVNFCNLQVVRRYEDAIKIITDRGYPSIIFFDHDLGDSPATGFSFAKYIIENDLDNGSTLFPDGFKYYMLSANPVGANNIRGILNNYFDTCYQDRGFAETERWWEMDSQSSLLKT